MGKVSRTPWSCASYSVRNGRQVSSNGGKVSASGGASAQIDAAKTGGKNGAPGVSAMNKSGSADTGRHKWGGSDLP